jgi:predicted ATPase
LDHSRARTDDGVLAEVPGGRLRGLLIALALEPGHVVPKSILVDWIWGERPPVDAANALQRLASRLRKALPGGVIEGQTGGNRLTVDPDAVDALRFERLVALARQEEGPGRVRLLREALALWRGAAMQDVGLEDSAAFGAAVTRLEGLRLTAMEDRFETEVSLGHGAEVVAELTDAVAAHPLREPLVAALMRALVAAGRDSEALLTYERTREALAGPGEIESSPAVRLLRDRAGAVRRDLAADARSLPTMVRVCRALDGMPLAIELAAARLRTMSLDQLANGLDDRFRLLTGGSRTALPRHKTLRAVVDWSWELLTDAERMVLRGLSVFAGGASLEAAERVCAGDAVERDEVLELLTSLAEKSLLLAEGDAVPRHRMIGTISEYAGHRLAEAGESDQARHAHLAYFTGLTETADPHLRRAEQVDWLAALEVEHDNIGAAVRGALAAGQAQAAMRLAAAAGWYWWLGGHKTEGIELLTAATSTPGEVTDDIRAMVYALVVHFVSSGRGDQNTAAEWIYRAYRFSQRSQSRDPRLAFVAPLERMLQAPDDFLPAWEALLDHEDPWVRALARLQVGKMRIVLGQGGRDADAYLEMALAEFRALGERFGISIALTELADRLAVRGEFAGACEHYEQAIAAVTEVGAIDDVIVLRSRQAQLYWLLGDQDASAAAIAEAERCAERVTWPDALAELALSMPAAAWPIQARPPELEIATGPSVSLIRIANAAPSMSVRPAM